MPKGYMGYLSGHIVSVMSTLSYKAHCDMIWDLYT